MKKKKEKNDGCMFASWGIVIVAAVIGILIVLNIGYIDYLIHNLIWGESDIW